MLFASLVFDRVPLVWSQLPGAFGVWLQTVGFVAGVCIAIFLAARALQRDPDAIGFLTLMPVIPGAQHGLLLRAVYTLSLQARLIPGLRYAIIASGVGYLIFTMLWLGGYVGIALLNSERAVMTRAWIMTLSGALALLVVVTPLLIDLMTRISWYRIWAIARLSWKEAVRGRVIWVFGVMALIFLFAEWFLPYKPENQIRNYVQVVYLSMTVLFLITSGLLGSFSIPNDVNNNSIHTIVTKPVEKFEIVLGRFLGFAGLLTVGLFVVSSLSLIYVVRGVNADAMYESYKARVPLYGHLHFAGTKNAQKADSVGREWGYRSYITGPTRGRGEAFRQFAIWDFAAIPAEVAQPTEPIVFEFSFDIFRLSKGVEGKGVFCTFTFVDVATFTSGDPNRQSQELESKTNVMKQERETLKEKARDKGLGEKAYKELLEKIDHDMVVKYRIFQASNQEVTDQHTQDVVIPAKLFEALVAESATRKRDAEDPQPALRAFLSVDKADQSQMLGVAQQDFYLLAAEKPFWQNFLKGVVGMWCTHMLILGITLACSTYLSSVISLLGTLFLYVAGLSTDYLKEIAEGKVDGGGPLESLLRITNRMPIAAKLEASPTSSLVWSVDSTFSWWIGIIKNLIPDVSRHDLVPYVANGFDIGLLDVLLLDNLIPLVGYLIPWAVLAYYLMKYREIANPQ